MQEVKDECIESRGLKKELKSRINSCAKSLSRKEGKLEPTNSEEVEGLTRV